MLEVSQLAESVTVNDDVAGSSPVFQPKILTKPVQLCPGYSQEIQRFCPFLFEKILSTIDIVLTRTSPTVRAQE